MTLVVRGTQVEASVNLLVELIPVVLPNNG